jgi:ubiquinone/menaquinone biosynthesis C-methylase UbiE
MFPNLPGWALEIAGVSPGDERQLSGIEGINLPLNRARLAGFLSEFADDRDIADLLALDVIGATAGLPLTSTGLAESFPSLGLRPFRLWEYAWLYRILNLSAGGVRVLDLGGPATHLTLLAALAGCRVTTIDINSDFVAAARECAQALKIGSLDPLVGDMRDLSAFSSDSFDVVVSCSVLEHLTGGDQEIALREMARVVKPGGLVGLTFDFGPSAAGANVYLPPPHDPPPDAAKAVHRFAQGGLLPVGNNFTEDPVAGCLFHNDSIRYTVASLFLAKPPAPTIERPKPRPQGRSVLASLQVENAPYRFYSTASRLGISLVQAEANRVAAEERLIELGLKEKALADLRAQLQQSFERANSLEAAAAERLTGLHAKDAALADLRAQLQQSIERANSLEAAAAERLTALHAKDSSITSLETTAAERLAALRTKEELIVSLETATVQHLAALRAAEAAVSEVRAELRRTQSDLKEIKHRFKTEGIREYLYRRFRRQHGDDGPTVLK